MVVLIAGLILMLGPHSLKLVAPGWRTAAIGRIGEGPFKGVYSIVALIGLVLIVWGFGLAWQSPTFLYAPPSWGRHLAMTLMIPALILAFASVFPARWIKRYIANPLLTATILWGVAHLFSNGDLAGVVLFGALLIWAIADLFAQPAAAMPSAAVRPAAGDFAAIFAGLALYAGLIAGLHLWLFGVSPLA